MGRDRSRHLRSKGWGNIPVKPNSPATVILCAESKTRLPVPTILSNLDTCASFALRCAALSRATFCSGVSRSGDDPTLPPLPGPPGPPAGVDECADPDLGEVKRGGGVAVLEVAWRELAVKRVASETLRGAAENRSVGFIFGCCLCISPGPAGWVPWVFPEVVTAGNGGAMEACSKL